MTCGSNALAIEGLSEIAHYYRNPIWDHGGWIKDLMPLFDGLALLVPDYLKDKPCYVDPAIRRRLGAAKALTHSWARDGRGRRAAKNAEQAARDKRWNNPSPADPNAGPISGPAN
jgi:hypothetical protein